MSTYTELPDSIKWTSLLQNYQTKSPVANGNYKDSKSKNFVYYFTVLDSLIHGQLICKDSNGLMRENTTYIRGTRYGKSETFLDGRPSTTKYYRGGSTYYEEFYYPDGNIKKRYQLIKHTNYVSEYYENGFLKSFGAVEPDGKSGHWVYRNPQGMTESEGEYLKGEKHGRWTYCENERTIRIQTYENGKLMKVSQGIGVDLTGEESE